MALATILSQFRFAESGRFQHSVELVLRTPAFGFRAVLGK